MLMFRQNGTCVNILLAWRCHNSALRMTNNTISSTYPIEYPFSLLTNDHFPLQIQKVILFASPLVNGI